jgi:hypothetical protein
MHTPSLAAFLLGTLALAAPAAADEPAAFTAPPLLASAPLAPLTSTEVGVAPAQHRDGATTERRSTTLMIAGITLATLGTGALTAGTALAVHGNERDAECEAAQARLAASAAPSLGSCLTGTLPYVGYSMIAGGASFLAAGIPMAIVGAWKVPVLQEKVASPLPSVRVGVGTAQLDWTF